MKKIISISVLMLLYCSMRAQIFEDICDVSLGMKSAVACPIDFTDFENEPIKEVKVFLIFFSKNDGTGGFQQNNPVHQSYINDMINYSNQYMSNIPLAYDPVCYDGSQGYFADSKIRFVYSQHYVRNSLAWNNDYYELIQVRDSLLALDLFPSICMFFTEEQISYQNIVVNQNCPIQNEIPTQSYANTPTTNVNTHLYCDMRGFFTKYYWMMECVVDNPDWESPSQSTVYSWLKVGRIQAHELTHNLSLNDIHKEDGSCAEHLMMHNKEGYGNFLTPGEIKDLHIALTSLTPRKYVSATTFSNVPYALVANAIWDSSIRIYRGINHTSGTFQITNELIIPSETDLVTTGSGSLALNNANIHTPHSNSTLDVKIQSSSNSSILNSTISNCSVEISGTSNVELSASTINLGSNGGFSVLPGASFTMYSDSYIEVGQ